MTKSPVPSVFILPVKMKLKKRSLTGDSLAGRAEWSDNDGEGRTRVVNHNFRTTEAEDALIRQKMQAYGIKNQSAFYRAIALNGYMLKLDLPEIREMIRLLKNLTNNVNQIARRLNEHGSIYETEIEDIQDRQKEIWETLNGILAKLEGSTG